VPSSWRVTYWYMSCFCFVFLHVCVSVSVSICIYVYLCVCVCLFFSFLFSVCVCVSMFVSVRMFFYLAGHLRTGATVYLTDLPDQLDLIRTNVTKNCTDEVSARMCRGRVSVPNVAPHCLCGVLLSLFFSFFFALLLFLSVSRYRSSSMSMSSCLYFYFHLCRNASALKFFR
jgi:hypothetical protein